MSKNHKTYTRFDAAQRIEHLVLILSFTTLAITGLVQKYPFNPVSLWVVSTLGGIEFTRIIHRIAAVVFVLQSVYHLVVAGYKLYVQRKQATMLPGLKDATDGIQHFLFNLGIRKERPKMGRYNFAEKVEYWAMLWGLVLMALTGFMLWNPIATSNILPGQFIPAAKVAHGAEAVLAVLAIILWHFYNVHIKMFNKSMFTGQLTRHEMEEEHALELEQIEAGALPAAPPEAVVKKRRMIFLPISAILTVAFVIFLYWFLTFEQTAITTIQPVSGAASEGAFSPRTPTPLPIREATPTRAAIVPKEVSGPLTWNTGIGELVGLRCGACHGAMGGLAVGTYADVLNGGNTGPAVIAGDADNSPLVSFVSGGSHPGRFEDAELELIITWINEGAEE